MVAIKYEANFISAAPEIATISMSRPDDGGAFTQRINSLLTSARTEYSRRAFGDAISSYKEARSEIFRLLNPAHSSWRHVIDDSFVLPVAPAFEVKIAEAGLKLAEITQPVEQWSLPPVGVAGTAIPAEAVRLDRIGFMPDASVSSRASAQSVLGVELLNNGFADQAAAVLDEAARLLAQPATTEAKELAASTSLALSSAQVLAGRPAEAATAATNAQALFAQLGDTTGQAQALHNQGSALVKLGRAQEAQTILTRAATLSRTLAPANTPAATPPRPAGPITDATLRATSFADRRIRTIPALVTAERDLSFVTASDTNRLALRIPSRLTDAGDQVSVAAAKPKSTASWAWGVPVGKGITEIQFKSGVRPDSSTLIDAIYKPRVRASSLVDLRLFFTGAGESNAYLSHLYAFVIPQALGDCYSQLGQYALAEQYYLQAAAYSFINMALEVPALWIRLADNRVRWGDSLYRDERIDECRTIYAALVTETGAPGASPLYSLPVFSVPAADARKLITNFAKPQNAGINPAIAKPLLTAWSRWQYLLAGLDFFGTVYTPILTFEYLQQTAIAFAQQAVQAEREYIDFQSRSEAAATTRRQLQSTAVMASAAVAAQDQLRQAAASDAAAASAAVALAKLRALDAAADRQKYAVDGYWQYVSSSIAAAHGAGADWHGDEIRQLAANMESGSWSGDRGKLAAAATLLGGQKSYEYQLSRLDNATREMNAMVPVAQGQADAAQHRTEAARLQYEASITQADLANDSLTAFDNNVFTPEVWARMAGVMRGLSDDYLDWAIRVARLMERAYNFENDDTAHVIRSQYPGAANVDNLFGADFLLRDIESFTYRFIANQRAKQSQLKDIISLANDYPFDFFRFQQTGRMTFETTLREADLRHPGFYGQRIAGVELEVIGLMPPEGVQGSLRAGGISRYRTADGGERSRIHTTDTLALSEFALRNDGFIFRVDPRMHGLFEGQGVATTWEIDLPQRSNNLDYRLITDVRLVVYYSAYYDQSLRNKILTAPPQPDEMIHVRSLLLRFDFPEVWYTLIDKGEATFSVTPNYLPRNEVNFRTQTVALVLAARDGVSPANVVVKITPPGKAVATMSTDAGGQIASQAGNALGAQLGGAVLGDWHIALQPAPGSPLLAANGTLDGDKLEQISLLLQYQFDWPA